MLYILCFVVCDPTELVSLWHEESAQTLRALVVDDFEATVYCEERSSITTLIYFFIRPISPRSVSLERGANNSEGPARSVAKHEAAVFAHLAGNAELLLGSDLTQSWEDQVKAPARNEQGRGGVRG